METNTDWTVVVLEVRGEIDKSKQPVCKAILNFIIWVILTT